MANTDPKRIVYVTPFLGSPVRYGWGTNIDQAQSAQLGHTPLGGAAPQGYVFGANLPKPARASRTFATGTVSSFIDVGAVESARVSGWAVGKAKVGRGGTTAKTITVYVTIEGVKYAWRMPTATQNRIGGDFGGLGLRLSQPSDTDLVFGASTPKPPRATKTVGVGDNVDRISTFYDPSTALPVGWSGIASGQEPTQAPGG